MRHIIPSYFWGDGWDFFLQKKKKNPNFFFCLFFNRVFLHWHRPCQGVVFGGKKAVVPGNWGVKSRRKPFSQGSPLLASPLEKTLGLLLRNVQVNFGHFALRRALRNGVRESSLNTWVSLMVCTFCYETVFRSVLSSPHVWAGPATEQRM